MQERVAVQFAAWMSDMAGAGRRQELHAALASVLGEDRAWLVAASAPAGRERTEGAVERERPNRIRSIACGADRRPTTAPGNRRNVRRYRGARILCDITCSLPPRLVISPPSKVSHLCSGENPSVGMKHKTGCFSSFANPGIDFVSNSF